MGAAGLKHMPAEDGPDGGGRGPRAPKDAVARWGEAMGS